ncbi:MAG: hypothetical protein QOG34_1283 [Frankiaceae bacterium]|nr:hypothetical protein [Frankiaceae bacterium]
MKRSNDVPMRWPNDHWPSNSVKKYLPELEQSERKALLAPVTIRLLLTALLVGLIVLTYVYLLAWVAVPVHIASDWIRHAPPVTHVHVGVRVAVPRGAYFRVSGLLSLIATAAFLGSAALDKRVARPLTDAILGAPVTRLLILALSYRAMVGKTPRTGVSVT